MVIIRLAGGLGNQLFQYAVGRALTVQMNEELRLDCSSFDIEQKRSYRLGHFRIRAGIANREDIYHVRSIKLFGVSIPPRQSFILEHLKTAYHRRTVIETNFHYNRNFWRISSPVYLTGYWQSEKYFRKIRDVLLTDITLKDDLSREDKAVLQAIRSSISVSVHVRRGDFVSDKRVNALHGVCSKEYYQRGMERIKRKIDDPHFFIFSDDYSWVRANLAIEHSVTLVNHNGPTRDFADLILMKSCSHHIIANSSFSWWGAWLSSEKHRKVVIAPSKWFSSSDRNTKDLLPSSWQQI